MDYIVEGDRPRITIYMQEDDSREPRLGLRPEDVACGLVRLPGGFTEKKLDGVSWQELAMGAYALSLDPVDFEGCKHITVLVTGRSGLEPRLRFTRRTLPIVPAPLRTLAHELPRTTLCGRILSLDLRPKAKIAITARIAQPPVSINGIAVTAELITKETDESGYFEFDVVTGTNLQVQIQALNFNRMIIVPPPPAVGVPVKLFSI